MRIKSYFSDFSIILVEDYKHSKIIVNRLLKKLGFEKIYTYENGMDFLKDSFNLHEKPDLVLMDIQMPVMNGVETFLEAKQSEIFKETFFVALTAFAMKGDREWLMLLGFDEYVPKPIDSQEFFEILKTFVQNKLKKRSPKKLSEQFLNVTKELVKLRFNQIKLQRDYIYKLIPEKIFLKLENSPQKLKLRATKVGVGFVDIRGYTHLSNILPVEEINEVLTAFFSLTAKIIIDNNCFLDKFIGDSVLWFSASNSEKKSAHKVINSAIQILENLPTMNKAISEKLHKNISLNLGIGLTCGSATVGLLGAPEYRFQYSIIGPPVNLASRLCANARSNEILLGGKIIDYCDYNFEKLGFVTVKGFEYDIETVMLLLPK